MPSRNIIQPITPLRRRRLRLFYEPLSVLHALDPIRGERIKKESNWDAPENNHQKLRRSFVDGIAYICARDVGPDYVTAAALEKTPQEIIVLLAANQAVEEKVQIYLKHILDTLRHVAEIDDPARRNEAGSQAFENLVTYVIDFNQRRLHIYYKRVTGKYAPPCLDVIKDMCERKDPTEEDNLQLAQLDEWLRKHFAPSESPPTGEALHSLVAECHAKRHTQIFSSLKLFSGQGQTRSQDFEQLFKLLGKIGKHYAVTRKLTDAAVQLRQDFVQGFNVKVLPSSKEQPLPLLPKEATIESTVGRMFSSPEAQAEFLTELGSIWHERHLDELLKEQRTTKTRVHAELLIANYLDKNDVTFLDGNDKYIGCSKPACYLCYAYIANHPSRYALPASHQKIYLRWRLPDIFEDEPYSACRLEQQEGVLRKLTELVRRDLTAEVKNRSPRRPYHADSTAEVTSSNGLLSYDVISMSAMSLLEAHPVLGEVQQVLSNPEEAEHSCEFSDDGEEGGVALQ